MARKGKINEMYDLAAIEAQQAKVVGLIGDLTKILGDVKPIALKLEGAEKTKEIIDGAKAVSQATQQVADTSKKASTSMGELIEITKQTANANKLLGGSFEQLVKLSTQNQIASKQLAASRRELDKAFKAGEIALSQYEQALTDIKKKELEISVSNQDLNRSLRNLEKGFQSSAGSLNEFRAELNLSLQAFDRLSAADKNSTVGAELKQRINELTDAIKEEEEATQRFSRNVGNYQGSAKIIVSALDTIEKKIETLKEKQQSFQDLTGKKNPIGFLTTQQAAEYKQVTAELANLETQAKSLQTVTNSPQFINLANVGDARKEIRGFTTTLIELEEKGLGGTQFAQELKTRLAQLTDQVADTRQEIKAMSSDTRTFDLMAGSINLAADAFQTAVGAAQLLGASEEDAAEATRTLMAVTAVSNGVKGIANELTTKGTAANKAYAMVQGLMATATDKTAASTVRLAAATKLLVGGLVIGGIALLITKYNDWFGATQKLTTEQKNLNDVNERLVETYVNERRELDDLVEKVQNETTSKKEKQRIVKELQETYPAYLGNIKLEGDEVKGLSAGYINLAKAMELKARAQAAGDLLAEQEKQLLKEGLKFGVSTFEQAEALIDKYKEGGSVIGNQVASQVQGIVAGAKESREQLKGIKKEAEDALNALGGDPTPGKGGSKAAKKDNTVRDQLQKDLKATIEGYTVAAEAELAVLQGMAEDEKKTLVQRTFAYLKYVKKKQQLIRDLAEFEKAEGNKSEEERKAIDVRAAADQIQVSNETQKRLLDLRDEYAEKAKRGQLPLINVAEASNSLKTVGKLLEDHYKNQVALKEKEKELYAERKATVRDFVDSMRNAFTEIFTMSIEKQQQENDYRIQQIEERKLKDVEAVTQSVLNEEERQRQIKIIEARAANEKFQIERKNRELETRKAQMEKMSALLGIAIQTARTVFEIKARAAVLLANPLTALLAPMALAQIPFVLASGALSAGLIAARPIPKYKDGTEDHAGGYAVVGDGGKREWVETPDGKIHETPATDTLVHMPAHSKVFKSDLDFMEAMHRRYITSASVSGNRANEGYQFKNMTSTLAGKLDNVEKAIKNIPRPIIEKGKGLKGWVHSGGGTTYL